jgi:uncharacterized protein with PIN domain
MAAKGSEVQFALFFAFFAYSERNCLYGETMRFIADVMLGRLAKRMRLLGFDVLYDRTFDDNGIIRLSLEQSRVILTRDTELVRRPMAANHTFIKHDAVDDQIRQILDTFMIQSGTGPLTRCSRCNEPLRPLSRRDARNRVPQYVYERYDDFLNCAKCERTYWRGTHVRRMGLTSLTRKQ